MRDTIFKVWDNDKKEFAEQTDEGQDILLNLSTGKLCELRDNNDTPPHYYIADLDNRYSLVECIPK